MLAASLCLAVATAAPHAAANLKWRALAAEDKHLYTFEHFTSEFGRSYSGAELASRKALFEANLAKIHAHNALESSWTEGVNQFTDMTAGEYAAFKGKVFTGAQNQLETPAALNKDLPASIDWRDKGAVTPVKNQGGCGSCWAFSSTQSVESAVFASTGTLPTLAPQGFVDCIPNPNKCGGTGGCSGSTEEYGFAWAMLYGCASNETYTYTAKTGTTCELGAGEGKHPPVAGISNFVKLPGNDYASLMNALTTIGPVSISVDASWGAYEKGVYKGCGKNNHTVIDHAVQAVGYGTEDGTDYFLVRNSWGPNWGEAGYIKLFRDATPTCTDDNNPSSGNGCKNGPKDQTVCGECGILSDSSYGIGGFMY
eukprot:SAG22_NODE_3081_length_1956_cov_2.281099_2_plen_368_part_00